MVFLCHTSEEWNCYFARRTDVALVQKLNSLLKQKKRRKREEGMYSDWLMIDCVMIARWLLDDFLVTMMMTMMMMMNDDEQQEGMSQRPNKEGKWIKNMNTRLAILTSTLP